MIDYTYVIWKMLKCELQYVYAQPKLSWVFLAWPKSEKQTVLLQVISDMVTHISG